MNQSGEGEVIMDLGLTDCAPTLLSVRDPRLEEGVRRTVRPKPRDAFVAAFMLRACDGWRQK